MIDRCRNLPDAVRTYARAGQTVMVGGFGRGGTPFSLLDQLADRAEDHGDLTLIKNDGNEPGIGVDRLLERRMVRHLITTHIGLNGAIAPRVARGELTLELVPQGTFAERIRAAGAGIPGFLSDVGIDSPYAEGRRTVDLDGRRYLLETALGGDLALLCADRVDRAGNAWWRGTNRNMNVVMGTACRRVIVETFEIVEIGALAPEAIHLPGVFVDAVVLAGPRRHAGAPIGMTGAER